MAGADINVLLVEDDDDDHFVTRALLSGIEGRTYRLEWVKTVEAGLDAMRSGKRDVCLLDYRLGERTGLDFLAAVPRDGSAPPVIFLTGHGDDALDAHATTTGAADYLVKGQISPLTLDRSIRYALDRTRGIERQRTERDVHASVWRAEEALRERIE